jgi:glycosyltransferase involved in cell wall biosynthesis
MAERMVMISTDSALYQECRRLGLERAKDFSWEKCAERTLQIIYETAAK